MAQLSPLIAHLLRRAGFGARPDERDAFSRLSYVAAVDALTNFDPATTDVDWAIGTAGYVGVSSGTFLPDTDVTAARQRWLFRMVHSAAPLQEKMALFWHHHFATGYSKIAGIVGGDEATRMMDAKPSTDTAGMRGQIESFRQLGLGKFRDLLVAMAKDPAMLVWLDGQLNVKAKPQENFGREIMELFTFGVEHYVETDVYAAARVFTGWNLQQTNGGTARVGYAFRYNAAQHDTGAKDFSFPIYASGSQRIEARDAATGQQDGLDFIAALARHPETADRLARRLWTWFVSETETAPDDFVSTIAGVYLKSDTDMRAVVRAILLSRHFADSARQYQRYAWPAEYVVRTLKEVGWVGYSLSDTLTPLVNMGQQLYEPPDVNGWELGPGWFSTGGTLARMNFAAQVASRQKNALRDAARAKGQTPESLVDYVISTLSLPPLADNERNALVDYVRAGGTYVASDTQLATKASGLYHLLTGCGEYQII